MLHPKLLAVPGSATSFDGSEPGSPLSPGGPRSPRRADSYQYFKLRGSNLSAYEGDDGAESIWRAPVKSVASAEPGSWRVTLRLAAGRGTEATKGLDGARVVCVECAGEDEWGRWRAAFEEAANARFDLHYKKLGAIGRGHFSSVYLAVDKKTGEKVAVKVIKKDVKDEAKCRKFIRREVKVMSITRHKNLIQALDFFSFKGKPHIVMEFLPGGSLKDMILRKKRLTESESKRLISGVLDALVYLHMNGIVHRDIKPENVLLDGGPEAPIAKVTDFGLSTFLGDGGLIHSIVGTPSYVSPELCAGVPYGTGVDMWSCGVMLYYMLSGERPFVGETRSQMKSVILAGKIDFPEQSFRMVGQNARRLILRMLDVDQRTRISAADALKHPWLVP